MLNRLAELDYWTNPPALAWNDIRRERFFSMISMGEDNGIHHLAAEVSSNWHFWLLDLIPG